MSRPLGVTASAVVAILGSIVMLLLAVLMVASLFITPPQSQPPNIAQLVVSIAAVCTALAGLGIWTAVGLFRLRSWARTSILVFAGCVAAVCGLSLSVTMAMPLPPQLTATMQPGYRLGMAVAFGIPLAIAVWWLIQFNTPSTKAAFASPVPGPASSRPLSISVIGWVCIVGAASSVVGILMRYPVFFLGSTFDGWTAGVIYAFFGALSVYIGKGLLDLRERARILAIGWFVLSFVHVGIVTLVPAWREEMFEMQRTVAPNQPDPIPFDHGMLMNVTLVFSAIVVAGIVWFLIRHRGAFVRPEV